jgi:hypothetical protein
MREVGFTIPYSDKTVYIASRTAEGPLRREVERYLAAEPNRDNVTWAQLKQHIQDSFLSPHEADKLRDEVQRIKENAYEGTAAYSRRFRDVSDLGYPPAARNADQHRIMKEAYLRGLRDQKLVERLVKEGRPADFMAAILLVEQYSSDDYALQRALDGVGAHHPGARTENRVEEPMEIGAVKEKEETSIRTDVDKIQKQVYGMSKQITKLCSYMEKGGKPTAQTGSARRPNINYQFTADGMPICVKCQQPGHVIRECQQDKGRQQAARRPEVQAATQQGGY